MMKKSRLIYLAPGFFGALAEFFKLCHTAIDLLSKVVNYDRPIPEYRL